MNHWKILILNNWRAKLVSLVVAALLWLAIRHAMMPSPAALSSATDAVSNAALST